jgi:hypothetical protein
VCHHYEGKSLIGSEIDIKRKTCDTRTWEKHLFLDISSTNTDTLVPSHFTSASKPASQKSFWLLSQPLPHLRFNVFVVSETFASKVEPLYATNISQHKQETFLYEYISHWVLLLTKTHNVTLQWYVVVTWMHIFWCTHRTVFNAASLVIGWITI